MKTVPYIKRDSNFLMSLAFLCLMVMASITCDVKAETSKLKQSPSPTLSNEMFAEVFIQVALSPYILPRNLSVFCGFDEAKQKDSFLDAAGLSKEYPWLYKLFYSNPLPRSFALNKWNKPIRISLGFPNNLKPYGARSNPGYGYVLQIMRGVSDDSKIKNQNVVIDQINLLTGALSQLTGLNVSYLSPEEESVDNYAEVRVVLMPNTRALVDNYKPDQYFGGFSTYSGEHAVLFDGLTANNMIGRVDFTPTLRKQVYGYYFPDKNNHIQMAVCYIWDGHDDKLLRALVNECLIRSLGLPGSTVPHMSGSYLGPWNDNNLGLTMPSNPEKLNPIDVELIKTLYSQKIEAGSDYLEIQKVLKSRLH